MRVDRPRFLVVPRHERHQTRRAPRDGILWRWIDLAEVQLQAAGVQLAERRQQVFQRALAAAFREGHDFTRVAQGGLQERLEQTMWPDLDDDHVLGDLFARLGEVHDVFEIVRVVLARTPLGQVTVPVRFRYRSRHPFRRPSLRRRRGL